METHPLLLMFYPGDAPLIIRKTIIHNSTMGDNTNRENCNQHTRGILHAQWQPAILVAICEHFDTAHTRHSHPISGKCYYLSRQIQWQTSVPTELIHNVSYKLLINLCQTNLAMDAMPILHTQVKFPYKDHPRERTTRALQSAHYMPIDKVSVPLIVSS